MSTQGKVQMTVGAPLAQSGVISNVATNEAQIKLMKELAGNVSGKRISPTEVITKRLSADEALVVDGQSIILADGVVSARNLVRSQQLIVDKAQIGSAVISGGHMDLGPDGALSALSANLGTITAGQIAIGGGGVVIGNTTSGISIGGNVIKCMKSGAPTITIDGSTGVVTCNSFQFTADGNSSLNLSSGTHNFSTGITIGQADRTLGSMVRTFAQATNPSYSYTLRDGDIWIDTGNGNVIKRWNGSAWAELQDADIGTALSAAQGSIKAGGGVTVDGQQYITSINLASGITVETASSGARTRITANGIAIYNYLGQLTVQLDHTNGVYVNNTQLYSDPSQVERYTWANSGSVYGWLAAAFMQDYGIGTRLVSVGSDLHLQPGTGRSILLWGNDVYAPSGKVRAIHTNRLGSYKTDSTFNFKDGDNRTHTVTFSDGVITSWSAY